MCGHPSADTHCMFGVDVGLGFEQCATSFSLADVCVCAHVYLFLCARVRISVVWAREIAYVREFLLWLCVNVQFAVSVGKN